MFGGGVMERECKKCGEVKAIEGFMKNKQCKHGREYVCKECERSRAKLYYQAHKEDLKRKSLRYYTRNKNIISVRWKKYYEKTKKERSAKQKILRNGPWGEKERERDRTYRKNHREKKRAQDRRYYGKHRDILILKQREDVIYLRDRYVSALLREAGNPVSPELIEGKRESVLHRRELKNLKEDLKSWDYGKMKSKS